MKTIRKIGLAMLLSLVASTVMAGPMSYNLSWSGSNGYSLTGMFSYQDNGQSLVGAGDLLSFMIEGVKNGSSMGVWSGQPDFFLFKPSDLRLSSLGQNWNLLGDGVGFGCLLTGCGLSHDGRIEWRSLSMLSKIGVSPKSVALSEPAGLALILAGLTAFGLRRWVAVPR